jgi:CelD/BcsL family acetyltransferase involved in cellulose biosynthesis
MTVSITTTRPADPARWDSAWSDCHYATFFHSRTWAELWSEYTAGRLNPAAVEVEFSDGATAVLPISKERGRVRTQTVSSPGATYGGWLSHSDLGEAHRAQLADLIVNQLGDVVWRVNPFDEPISLPAAGERADDETQAVPLDEEFAAITKRWTKGHLSAAKKARREGVTVALAETDDDWADFATVYADSIRRWGDRASTTYEPRMIELLQARAGEHVRLWLARFEGRPAAGALCLYSRRHVSYWLGGAAEELFSLRPVHLLMYEAIEDACRGGYAWFDFNPSGGHEGVAAFKKGFGTERLATPVVTRTGRLARVTTGARRLISR